MDDELKFAYEMCMEEDRSIDYTIQFMQDYADVSFEEVMAFLKRKENKE
jgi:hypothetical protein